MSDDMRRLRMYADEIEEQTGIDPFGVDADPVPVIRIAIGNQAFSSLEDCLATVERVVRAVDDGTWDVWACRQCGGRFEKAADRNAHEEGHAVRPAEWQDAP